MKGLNPMQDELKNLFPLMMLRGLNTPICAAYLITKPVFVIGKAKECDARLFFSSEISRRHAQISWANGSYTIIDLNSTNKTYLNGCVLEPQKAYPLRPQDTVSFSGFTFLVEQLEL